MPIDIRPARAADAPEIAHLHAESWRHAYAGILDDAYLAEPVERDHRRHWRHLLADPDPSLVVLVLEEHGRLRGFVSVELEADARWGALIENLHVSRRAHRQGFASHLLARAARRVAAHDPMAPVHLWVYEENRPAIAFYERIHGRCTGRQTEDAPGGGRVEALRYAWSTPARLLHAVGVRASHERAEPRAR